MLISMIRVAGGVALALIFAGCHESGTWQNDTKNWKRAFGSAQPKDIKIVNSWYWRSPHFTYEFEYFFQLGPNDAFRQKVIGSGNLLDITPATKAEGEEAQRFFHSKPTWFIPKAIDQYEIWRGKPPQENFRIFIDRATGDLFLTDSAV